MGAKITGNSTSSHNMQNERNLRGNYLPENILTLRILLDKKSQCIVKMSLLISIQKLSTILSIYILTYKTTDISQIN